MRAAGCVRVQGDEDKYANKQFFRVLVARKTVETIREMCFAGG